MKIENTGILINAFGVAVQSTIAYLIGKNYWKKSGWGKAGTIFFGAGAVWQTELLLESISEAKANTLKAIPNTKKTATPPLP